MSFEEVGLDASLIKALEDAFSIKNPTNIQLEALKTLLSTSSTDIMSKSDILLKSQTGSGKTLAFLLPILHRLLTEYRQSNGPIQQMRTLGTQCIIVVPTRELAAQTHKTLEGLLNKVKGRDHWIVVSTLSGGDRKKAEKERLRKGVHIVVGTPGRLLDHFQNTSKWADSVKGSCRWIVLDEADRLVDSGFEKSVNEIIERCQGSANRTSDGCKIILCSATVKEGTTSIFGHTLQQPIFISAASSTVAKNKKKDTDTKSKEEEMSEESSLAASMMPSKLEHYYFCTPTKYRLAALVGYLEEVFSAKEGAQKVVLFTICCDTVDYLHCLLTEKEFKMISNNKNSTAAVSIAKLHGNMEHKQRLDTFNSFTKQTSSHALLICTDIAARGLNLTRVSHILQYDAPCDINDYIHRAGRTAREQEDGGKSILFLMPSEKEYLQKLKEKGCQMKAGKWSEAVERVSQRVKLTNNTSKVEDKLNSEKDEDDTNTPIEVKKRIIAWLDELQEKISKNGELLGLAKKSFLSFVRAYATHSSAEKFIFHIRKLHLGHLAETFLLKEPPTVVAAKQAKSIQKEEKRELMERGRSHSRGSMVAKRKVGEFDAGDADFMKPRKKL